ncbi:sulfatase-like hydrolase/transferase [Novosphingobium sp. FSY-8]|uniref:Sulfatase-like hydrolase/transferase n=1 Tax=Novosphingobium ovatum TaxID=1908523 RepID=A0ABW9X954_9SPHN|nr:sulfatase-like hydrolase/transferase [Novosphingobium ovatum]NBC35065.1 sulfatase-like hydrolase/transferase [Novosphingobium ovatum]
MSARMHRLTALAAMAVALAPFSALAQPAAPAPAPAAPAPVAAPAPRTSGPPNIVLILADDVGVEGFGAYGGEYPTPNIDRLAAQGVRFANAHAMPLCSPTRLRLMTGQDNHRNYEAFGYLAPGQTTFANVLKSAGYATGIVGKWQLMGNGYDGRVGITPQAAGFDEHHLWQLKALDAKGSRYWGPTRVVNGRNRIAEEGFGPDADSRFALDFISRNKDRPFFLYYPMVLVHSPFVPVPGHMDTQGAKPRFANMVAYMDNLVGQVMDRLKAEGLDQNTIVIFTADNGTNRQITSTRNGVAVQGGKGTPTLSGTHVPLMVWAPGRVPVGQLREGLFDLADVLPTLAQIGGARAPAGLDGVNQWPVITGQQAKARDWIFQHYAPEWQFAPMRFVFDAGYKLYGDGRFVALDPATDRETDIPADQRKGEAARHYAALQKAMASVQDGPLAANRFPWCAGQASRDPALPATQAGCAITPGGEE